MLFQIVMKKEQVDNYYSAFTVLRICRDEVVLTQHCSGLFDRNEGDLVAANGGDWLDFEDNSEVFSYCFCVFFFVIFWI